MDDCDVSVMSSIQFLPIWPDLVNLVLRIFHEAKTSDLDKPYRIYAPHNGAGLPQSPI